MIMLTHAWVDDDCDDGMGFDLTRRESRIEDDDIYRYYYFYFYRQYSVDIAPCLSLLSSVTKDKSKDINIYIII